MQLYLNSSCTNSLYATKSKGLNFGHSMCLVTSSILTSSIQHNIDHQKKTKKKKSSFIFNAPSRTSNH